MVAFDSSQALKRIKPSPTLAVTKKSLELKAQGKDVIALGAGEPDFDTPQHIKDAAIAAINSNKTRYTAVDGIPELKQAIIDKFKRENNITYTSDEITVGTGGKQVLFNALVASVDAGDEVIIPAPYWVSYPDIVEFAGGRPVFVIGSQENGFKITPQQLEEAITPRTRWFIFNSPSNPTGAGYTRDEIEGLCDVLLRYPHVFILSDDIYEHVVYDDFKFATIAEVCPTLKDRTLTLNGVSKSYCMTGWRIGYAGGSAPLIKAMGKLQSQSTSNPTSISQYAAVAALNGTQDFIPRHNAVFKERRDMMVDGFNRIEGLYAVRPQGAFYIYVSCEGVIGKISKEGTRITSDAVFAASLLEEQLVAVVSGDAFGLSPYFRISYATSTQDLQTALERIEAYCRALK